MIRDPIQILCIGGAVLDRTLNCTHGCKPGVSNPVTSARSFGGVARNVAESLARLGARVDFVSAVGDDAAGRELKQHLSLAGADTQALLVTSDHPTAEYIAAFHTGEMRVAFADMGIFDYLTPERIAPAIANLPPGSILFADCNLPAASLAMLCERGQAKKFLLAIDGVSPAKFERLPSSLEGVTLLFVNSAQAMHAAGTRSAAKALLQLLDRGCHCVVMTSGRQGLTLSSGGESLTYQAPNVPIVNVSGAGDAIVAGTLFGLSERRPPPVAVSIGLGLAALVLQSPNTVPAGLTRTVLELAMRQQKDPDRVH